MMTFWLRIAGVLGVAVCMLVAGCGQTEQVEQTEQKISVKGMVIGPDDYDLSTAFTGSLEGERQAVLYAKVAEAVDSIWVREGGTVMANQVVLSLDRYGATTNFREAQSTFLNAQKNYRKMEFLFKEGAVSESDYDAARTNYEVSKASFDAVTRLVEITSPISGVVTSVNVSEGDFASIGQELATVATTERLRARFGVNPAEIGYFRKGDEVKIASDNVAETGYGKVARVASSADPATRTFQVEVTIDNAAGHFSPGMFVRINYIRERLTDVIAIPRSAILTLDNKETVFTARGDRAEKRILSLGAELGGKVVVDEGLAPGDTLIILGQDYLDDSMLINVTDVEEPVQ